LKTEVVNESRLLTKKTKIKVNWLPYFLILPALLLIIGFVLYPIVNVFYYSLQHFSVTNPFYNGYAGFGNYTKIFTDDNVFYAAVGISSKWVLIEVSLQLLFGMILALVLNQTFRLRSLFRTVSFLPWAVSGVITSTIWSIMFNEHIGVVNDLFIRTGIIDSPVAWLAGTNTAFWSVVVSELWRGIPFFTITLLASLQTVPSELYEAARVDGAGRWSIFANVTLPFLKETIILTTLLRAVWEFNNVDLIYNLTGGGPVNVTTTLPMYVANMAIKAGEFGYGSALTVIAFFILLIFAVVYLKLSGYGKETT
jgi:multiple sugar transport system permease protein